MGLSRQTNDNGDQLHRKYGDEVCPVEDELSDEEEAHEGPSVKPLKSTAAPSRQEVLEHNITRYPLEAGVPTVLVENASPASIMPLVVVNKTKLRVSAFLNLPK